MLTPRDSRRAAAPATAALIAALSTPALGVDWLFTEDYNSLSTGDLLSVDGIQNPAKGDIVNQVFDPATYPSSMDFVGTPATYEAQFGFGSAPSTTQITNGTLELIRDPNVGTEAFSVVSTGLEANAPRNQMAAATVKFRIDSAGTDNLGASANGFHISFYRNLIHNGTRDDGPWVNNIAALKFRNIGASTFDLWADGYLSPFGSAGDAETYRSLITTLDLDTWYTAEVYMPAFNAATTPDHVDAQFRVLDETGTTLLAYGAQESHHLLRSIPLSSFSTENTPEITGIQTINTQSMNAKWAVDDLKIGEGTAADIDAIRANLGGGTGSYWDYNFDGTVDGTDVDFYLNAYLLTELGDVDLDRDVDDDDKAIVQANLNTAGGYGDGDITGDGLVDALDLAFFATTITGDYDGSGQVEQGDLDLVLQNWGTGTFTGDENALVGGGPFDGTVDQNELDGVLQNWGSTSAPDFDGAAVPEPAALALLGVGGLAALRRRV